MTTVADPVAQDLSDRVAVENLITLFANGLDRHEFAMASQGFAPDGHLEINGASAGPGPEKIAQYLTKTYAQTRRITLFLNDLSIEFKAGAGRMENYATSHVTFNRPGGEEFIRTRGLRYETHAVRVQGEWRIKRLSEKVDWEQEDISAPVADPAPEPERLAKFTCIKDLTPQQIADRIAIRDASNNYAKGIDAGDMAAVRHIFTPDVHAVYIGRKMDRDTVAKMALGIASYRVGYHFMGNQLVELHGDTADVESYVLAHVGAADHTSPHFRVRLVRYIDKAVRRNGGWVVAQRFHEAEWCRNAEAEATLGNGKVGFRASDVADNPVKTLADVSDRMAIQEVLQRYAKAIDNRDWDTAATCFADDVHSVYNGQDLGVGPKKITDSLHMLANFKFTRHLMGNHVAVLRGDTAQAETYVIVYVGGEKDGKSFVRSRGVRFIDKLVKRNGRWLIKDRLHTWDWVRQEPCVFPASK